MMRQGSVSMFEHNYGDLFSVSLAVVVANKALQLVRFALIEAAFEIVNRGGRLERSMIGCTISSLRGGKWNCITDWL